MVVVAAAQSGWRLKTYTEVSMPCPFFEPQRVAPDPLHPGARVPLLEEYDGKCHAVAEAFAAPADLRFQCCNHGYSRGACASFPVAETRSSIRLDILRSDTAALEILYLEECDHAPLRWQTIRYALGSEILDPDPIDICARAQVLAFCRSYLRRFGALKT